MNKSDRYYDPFGNHRSIREQEKNRYGYTGEAYDNLTEQYYLRARYYNPSIARFTQEDEYRGDGLNLYANCGNKPVMYAEPSGYKKGSACGGTGADDKGENPVEKTHDRARNTLINELDKTRAFTNGSMPYNGRLESSYGYNKQIGKESLDGKVRWILDYDPDKGVHYNFEDFTNGKGVNAVKIAIPIDISYSDYTTIIDWYNN